MKRRRKRKDPLIFLPVKVIFYVFDEIFDWECPDWNAPSHNEILEHERKKKEA